MPRLDGQVVPEGHFNVKCNTGGKNSGDQEKDTGALWELETEPGASIPCEVQDKHRGKPVSGFAG